MQLARFLTKLFKEGGLVLIDANSKKYVIGNPKKENPLTLKLLDKSLHYKLLFYPDLYFVYGTQMDLLLLKMELLQNF